jgi:hypothetical protein
MASAISRYASSMTSRIRVAVVVAVCAEVLCAGGVARGEGASFRATFDQSDAALNKGAGYKDATNDKGLLGWGESYVMMSYATMFRHSRDPAYLIKLAEHGASVLASTDKARGVKDFAGCSRACWLSTKYSGAGNEPVCWCVHTGMIAAPLAELGALLAAYPQYGSLQVPGRGTLTQVAAQLVKGAEAAAAVHDAQYKSGPGSGEGHYRGDAKATFFAYAGKELPKNWSTAMGRLLLSLHQATGKAVYLQKAKAIATYLKARLIKRGGGWTWTYGGSDVWSQGKGEDISHAAISVDFAARAREAKLVFTPGDIRRFGRTLFEAVHIDSSTVADRVDGAGKTNTYTLQLGRWLAIAPYEPRVWPIVATLFVGVKSGGGSTLSGLANVARFAPPVRHYDFYTVDWQDLGTTRKATAYGANILALPPQSTLPMALRLGYRAQRVTTVQQWDGKAYHDVMVLAPKASGSLRWLYLPYDPAIHHAYSGKQVLFQFTDVFVAGQGIEVAEVTAVKAPTISTTQLTGGTEAQAYAATAAGSGDAPLRWSLTAGPEGLTVDAETGALSWASPIAGSHTVGLRLDNDAGNAGISLPLVIAPQASDQTIPDAGSSDQGALLDATAQGDVVTPAGDGAGPSDSDGGSEQVSGDGCAVAGAPAGSAPLGSSMGLGLLLLALWYRRRRRGVH